MDPVGSQRSEPLFAGTTLPLQIRVAAIEKGESIMTMRITYPDGSIEIIPEATRVDQQNFHEGMYDFYDERGVLLRQIDMQAGLSGRLLTSRRNRVTHRQPKGRDRNSATQVRVTGGRRGSIGRAVVQIATPSILPFHLAYV
jgi:hypothetical protein